MAELGHVLTAGGLNGVIAGFEGRIRAAALRYRLLSRHMEDAVQEGRIAVWKAAVSYNGKVPFDAYASACVKSSLLNMVKYLKRKKRFSGFGPPVSADGPVTEENGAVLGDFVSACVPGPEEEAVSREFCFFLRKAVREELTLLEESVFSLFAGGLSYRQIASALGIEPKSVDCALQRARRKLQERCRKEWLSCASE